jgi:type I restriction enzyme S subunit
MGKASKQSAFNQQINAIQWSDYVIDGFGFEMLKSFKGKIARDGASTTLPILKKSLFQKIRVPLPPLDLQQRFAEIVSSVEEQKAKMRKHLKQLDDLFASLQQRAFRGDL